MKAILVGPIYPYRGGIAHFTEALADAIREARIDLELVSYKKLYPKLFFPGKTDKEMDEKKPDPRANFIYSPFDPVDWLKTWKFIHTNKPDLVIFQWWVTAWSFAYSYMFGKLIRAGIPFRVLVHNAIPHEKKWYDIFLTRKVFFRTKEVVCLSESQKIKLEQELGYKGRVCVTPHPIYKGFGSSEKSHEEFLAGLGINQGQKIILFFGFVRPYKGLEDLIEAIGLLRKKELPVTLVVAGEFWMKEDGFRDQIARLEIEDHVKIVNKYIPDHEVADYFEHADLFVAPYNAGTQSGALKLAMGYGLPAVITSTIKDESLSEHQEGIFFVRPSCPLELADQTERALRKEKQALNYYSDKVFQWQTILNVLFQNKQGDIQGFSN